jgi:hypothetical protein
LFVCMFARLFVCLFVCLFDSRFCLFVCFRFAGTEGVRHLLVLER